jgi:hypothetical protein
MGKDNAIERETKQRNQLRKKIIKETLLAQ